MYYVQIDYQAESVVWTELVQVSTYEHVWCGLRTDTIMSAIRITPSTL